MILISTSVLVHGCTAEIIAWIAINNNKFTAINALLESGNDTDSTMI